MGWLHTWLGVALAAVLFAVFWMGTLTVFDKEIDQWMKPELRLGAAGDFSLDDTVLPRLAQLDLAPDAPVWIGPPRERAAAIRLYYEDTSGESHEEFLDPYSGQRLDVTDSHAGEFVFRFHFMLHLPGVIGYVVVGIAAVGMLALIVSGVFIHRKFFQEFFTFRPDKQRRRRALDLHNLTAVIALPFHFILPFSGLLILATTYFPWSMAVPFGGDTRQLSAEQRGYELPKIDPAGVPGAPITSLDRPFERAQDIWRSEEGARASSADWVALFHPHDAKSYVVVERYFPDRRVAIGPDQIVFDARTGAVIDRFEPRPVHSANNWIEGLHWLQFDHWPLRWLYFFAGLSGCVMIGSGLIFWMQARIRKGLRDPASVRVMRAISVAAISGVMLATCAFLIANRLLPKELTFTQAHRHDLEIWTFFGVWLAAFVHAALRGRAAWRDQCGMIAIGAALAVVLNWFTTGGHPFAGGGVRPVVIMDLLLLAGAALAFLMARRLRSAGIAP